MKKEPKLIELFIFSKKIRIEKEGKKISFIKYGTYYNAKLEDGTRKKVWYEVKFTKDAFNNATCKIDDVKRGLIKVDSSKVYAPDRVLTRKSEKTGNDYYVVLNESGEDSKPIVWVRENAVISYEPIELDHEFNFNTEEKETEEVEVKE